MARNTTRWSQLWVMGLVLLTCFFVTSAPVAAHEVWLEPQAYTVKRGGAIRADIKNGQRFEGSGFAYNAAEYVRFQHFKPDGGVSDVTGRLGDEPALAAKADAAGLHMFAMQTKPEAVRYETWKKFAAFIDEKKLGGSLQLRHDARGLPRANFNEAYARFAKTLVAVGDGAAGADRAVGFEIEIVALQNPYKLDETAPTVPVKVLYQGTAKAGIRLTVFARQPDGALKEAFFTADGEGVVRVPVEPGTTYLLDAVVIREPSPTLARQKKAVWETLWASLTFQVPARSQ